MLTFGRTPVPFTASWSSETPMFLARCRHAEDRVAVCQPSSPGEGKPLFGKPHMVRQRQAMSEGLCDLCGRPLKGRSRISLSHARARSNAAVGGTGVLQVEPLLHRDCAAICLRHCPSLRQDLFYNRLEVRRVTRSRVQFAILTADATEEFCGVRHEGAIGHAKIELLRWVDETREWSGLGRDAA